MLKIPVPAIVLLVFAGAMKIMRLLSVPSFLASRRNVTIVIAQVVRIDMLEVATGV